jgi:hypothetical protein
MSEADIVLDAFSSRRLIGLLSDGDPSFDEERAYSIASEVHERRLGRGEKPVGRKIGFTNRAIWAQRGLAAPIWGYMYDSTVHYAGAGPAQVDIGHLIQPRIEPEIQLHFARTPPATRDGDLGVHRLDRARVRDRAVPLRRLEVPGRGCDRRLRRARPARDRPAGCRRRHRELRSETPQLHPSPSQGTASNRQRAAARRYSTVPCSPALT